MLQSAIIRECTHSRQGEDGHGQEEGKQEGKEDEKAPAAE